jgi:hypothetical protein
VHEEPLRFFFRVWSSSTLSDYRTCIRTLCWVKLVWCAAIKKVGMMCLGSGACVW